jgi:hypothetical protein
MLSEIYSESPFFREFFALLAEILTLIFSHKIDLDGHAHLESVDRKFLVEWAREYMNFLCPTEQCILIIPLSKL